MKKPLILLLATLLVLSTVVGGTACNTDDTTTDTKAPVISDITVSNITETTATISWTTDKLATSNVAYVPRGVQAGLSSPAVHQTMDITADKTSHSMNLGSLSSNTHYIFWVKSKDAAGNEAISDEQTFTTDITPPSISDVFTASITETTATVTWTTDEESTSQVEYGTTMSYGSITFLDEDLVISHSMTLSGLELGTTYYYRVKSQDEAGNGDTSDGKTFSTVHIQLPPTSVGGTLIGGVVWTSSASPYILTSHILIPQDASLTIEPGVHVTLNDSYIQVDGILRVLGTSSNPVLIEGEQSWYPMITFTSNCIGWDESTGSGTIVSNAIIEGKRASGSLIDIQDSSPRIQGSKLSTCGSVGGIKIVGGSPQIISNTIACPGYGIWVINDTGGSPQIICNTIQGLSSSSSGINLDPYRTGEYLGGGTIRVERNVITGYNVGIEINIRKSSISILSNNISGCREAGLFLGVSWDDKIPEQYLTVSGNAIDNDHYNIELLWPYDFDLSGNWWGTKDPTVIEAKFYHSTQDFNLGTITYVPFLKSMPTDVSELSLVCSQFH